jgi:hypothetical protein
MKKLLVSSLTIASLLAGASLARSNPSNIIVDDFNAILLDPILFAPLDTPPNSFTTEESGLPELSVIGGTRQTTLEFLEPILLPEPPALPQNETDTTTITIGSDTPGVGEFDQSIFGDFGNFTRTTVTWNGGTGLEQNVADFDRFELTVNLFDLLADPTITNDLDIGTITIRVKDTIGTLSELSKTLDEIDQTADPVTFRYYFSEFTDPSVFANTIQEIQLEITGQQGLLFTLEEIVITTPEPSFAVSLLGLAAVQVVVTGWRKRK